MADQKISELTALTGANVADDDALAIVDTSSSETKKIVFSELKNALDTATGFVRITGDTMTGALTTTGLTVEQNVGSKITLKSTDTAILSGEIIGDIEFYSSDASGIGAAARANITVEAEDAAGRGSMYFKTSTGGASPITRTLIQGNGDISFYEDTGSTPKFFWSAADERLGIGTSSPTAALDVRRVDADGKIAEFHQSTGYGFTLSSSQAVASIESGFLQDFVFKTGSTATERMRIDSSGNVGIGEASPSTYGKLVVAGSTPFAVIRSTDTTTAGFSMLVNSGSNGVGSIGTDNGGHMTFDTGSTGGGQAERMRIDSSGNVGIGTTSPDANLHVFKGESGGATPNSQSSLVLENSSNTYLQFLTPATNESGMLFGDNDNDRGALTYNHSSDSMSFSVAAAVRMRIDSSGNLLHQTTTTNNLGTINRGIILRSDGGTGAYIQIADTGTSSKLLVYFHNGNGVVGSISTSGSATAYNTSSDYRLKTDAQPMTGATDRLKQLNPVNFEWIADGTRVDGFLAHEAQAVVPEAVTGTKDAMRDEEYEVTPAVTDDDGNVVTEAVMGTRSVPDYQGIDQSKLVPLLVATIKELEARITALENA